MKKIEIYLKHIEEICGEGGKFFKISDPGENPPITVVSYPGVPESGCTTAFSFGLSSVAYPEWVNSRPELVISVNSLDSAWPIAMGEIIRNGRGRCAFSYGMILDFGQPIAEDSKISCFLVYACTVLHDSDLAVQLPDRRIHLSQVYPVYKSETSAILEVGAEGFVTALGIDLFDVQRRPYSQPFTRVAE